MSVSRSYEQCDFCGAHHSGPNAPGSCVLYWQREVDQFRAVAESAGRVDRIRRAQAYLSPGDKAQPGLAGELQDALNNMGHALTDLKGIGDGTTARDSQAR